MLIGECLSMYICTYLYKWIQNICVWNNRENYLRIIANNSWDRNKSILKYSNDFKMNYYFSDNDTSDKLIRRKRNYRTHFNRNPSNWLYLGSKFATWIERLQSERLSILQQHSRGHWLQVRRPTRWILCERTSQVSGKNNNQTPGTRYQRLWKAKFKRELISSASRCNNYLDASNDTLEENFLTILCRVI